MSWFKKLFQIFKSEEDEYIENVPPEKQEGSRDVDAKILYQYPKGQFRFPLIPDEDQREKRPRNVERVHQQKTSSEPVKSRRTAASHKIEPKNNREKVTETREERTQKKNYASNRPFRPTEIPSPIYGFEKPARKSAPVEFELETFSNKDKIQVQPEAPEADLEEVTLQASSLEPEHTVTDIYKPIYKEQAADIEAKKEISKVELDLYKSKIDEEPEATTESVIKTKAEPQSEHSDDMIAEESQELTQPLAETEILTEPELEIKVQESVLEPDVDLEEEPAAVPEPEVVPEEELEPAIELDNGETVSEEHELEVTESEPELFPIMEESEKQPEWEIELTESVSENEPVLADKLELDDREEETDPELEQEIQELILEPEQEQDELVEKEAEEDLEEAPEWESTSELEVDPSPEPKKRSHIPFNVIMLKEDRKKLEQRNMVMKEIVKPIVEVSPAIEAVKEPEEITEEEEYYVFPSMELLNPPVFKSVDKEWLEVQEQQLNETLFHFNVRASVANVTQGPSVTRFEVHPEPGVKVNKITNLADDIKLSLAAKDIRMEAPIPGTHMIGIEVPNDKSRPVLISEILTTDEFLNSTSPLTAVLGLDISGKPIVTDLRKMPHGLIAGATGSGKSVCINSILVSLLYKANPNEVKLLLIDPKMVELAPYNQIPHLVSPVITDVKAATAALKWAVDEMERRYELFVHAGVREISRYNEIADQERNYSVKLPYIVIVIDELADLMMMSPADVEEAIARIAQKARACGIHLIIATQRPSVDVITGLIKANVPTRIAFSVSSQIDSRTIIDISGAERLLGRGDMLFLENGSSKPVRLQGTYVSDGEIDSIVAHVRREQSPQYLFEQEELLKKASVSEEEDELFYEACEYIIEQGGASTSSLQRKFKIGYNRAARLIDMMEEQGFISEAKGSKPRDVLITESELESMQED